MKKLVLLCTMLATLCCLAYAEYQINAPGYDAAKDRYYQLVEKIVDGTATYAEAAEFSDLCQVYGFDVPPVEPPETERGDRGSLDDGGTDCGTPTVINDCPYSDTGNLDGDNDCSPAAASPSNDLFYEFRPAFTGYYQMRLLVDTTAAPAIRIVKNDCCTGASVRFSSSSVATDCKNPIAPGNELSTRVTYLFGYLSSDTTYWIHVGTSTATLYFRAYEFNLWCFACPPDESPVHNTCLTAQEIACNDSILGDSASSTNSDWYKIVIPDFSPNACSLYVFVGAREMGHCLSGRYPTYASSSPYAVDGRFTLYKERVGEPCVYDSVTYSSDDGCSFDAVKQVAVDPGTYYIRVWNNSLYEYVLLTRCIEYNPYFACCFLDGSCSDMLAGACAAAGGWTKPGIQCSSNPCPPTPCAYGSLDDELLNNTCGPTDPEVFCENWYCGVLPTTADVDWYKLVIADCESLVVDIFGNATPSQWPFGQGLNPYVYLYAPDCATIIASNNDNTGGVDPDPVPPDSRIKKVVGPGTYYIKVNATSGTWGPYVMHISCYVRECVPGDDCGGAIAVGIPSATAGTTVGATVDFPPFCVYAPTSGGVWYKVTGTGTMLTADVCISSFDTRLNVYSGPCESLVCIDADDDDCATPNSMGSTVTWCAQSGVDYYILVYGYSSNTGTFTLTITQGNPCGTGACCDPLTGGCTTGTLDECTALGGNFLGYGTGCDPNPCPQPCLWPNRDDELVNNTCSDTIPLASCGDTLCGSLPTTADPADWYKLVIPTGYCDTVVVRVYANDTPGWPVFGQGLDPYVALYASDCVTQLAYNDDNYGTVPEPVSYDSKLIKGCLEAGTYYIRVTAPYTDHGPYVLVVQCIPCECPHSCDWYTLCGTPGEVEPNDVCPAPAAQAEITCDATVYGLHCPSTDKDFWKITVPPMTIMTVKVYTGMNCDVNPASGVLFRYYNDTCGVPSSGTASSFTLNNATATPLVKYLEVYDTGTSQVLYKVVATCCVIENYCENPILIPGEPVHVVPPLYVFDDTVNTCCATNVVDTVRSTSCTVGYLYPSGPDVVFKFTLTLPGILNIVVRSLPSGDGQFMVFTDCSNPRGTCVASHDDVEPETINNLALAPGTYYISVSRYTTAACGDMWLHITSDVPLPVELMGDVVATAGSEKVTLRWATASETNNDRFEIVRNGQVIGHVTGAGTSPSRHDYAWSEEGLNNGVTYTYTLRSVDINSAVLELATVSATPSFAAGEVTEYALHQNYPNPFNPITTIAFDLLEAGNVSLKIYNLMGQEVRAVVNGTMPKGRHIVSFDAGSLASGIYLYRVEVNGFAAEKKMLLMK